MKSNCFLAAVVIHRRIGGKFCWVWNLKNSTPHFYVMKKGFVVDFMPTKDRNFFQRFLSEGYIRLRRRKSMPIHFIYR